MRRSSGEILLRQIELGGDFGAIKIDSLGVAYSPVTSGALHAHHGEISRLAARGQMDRGLRYHLLPARRASTDRGNSVGSPPGDRIRARGGEIMPALTSVVLVLASHVLAARYSPGVSRLEGGWRCVRQRNAQAVIMRFVERNPVAQHARTDPIVGYSGIALRRSTPRRFKRFVPPKR